MKVSYAVLKSKYSRQQWELWRWKVEAFENGIMQTGYCHLTVESPPLGCEGLYCGNNPIH